jgi:hypothetical protein
MLVRDVGALVQCPLLSCEALSLLTTTLLHLVVGRLG